MKLLINLAIFYIIFLTIDVHAQDTTIVYFSEDWKKVESKDNAWYYRKAFKDNDNNKWMAYDYYINGNIQMICSFKTNKYQKQHGQTTYYYENGHKDSEGEYVNSNREGKWTFWRENGKIDQVGYYDKGIQSGPWKGWFKNEKPAYTGSYKSGKMDGTWVLYYETGVLRERITYSNGNVTRTEGFYKNGNKRNAGDFLLGNKDGKWTIWNEDGQKISEGRYRNGVKDGLWIRYFESEQFEVHYHMGTPKGEVFGGMIRRN